VLLKQVEQAGFLGKKNRQGFYQYPEGDKPTINSAINETLPRMQRKAGPADWHRLIMLMVAEASRCLADKVVATAADIDTGMVFGTGFPPFRGGLCRWADQLPLNERQSAVMDLAKMYGERFDFSIGYQETLKFYST
jgi:3-hydroxyacyl-CoA dehydrogenase/enoyl-CoA hydratase/3-hydroxybutyryl-CoA epimerase